MQYDRLVSGLAGVLGAITVVMTVLGVAYNPTILFVALTFGAATYFVYYHASGRLAARVYRRVERQAARNAGGDRRRRTRQRRARQQRARRESERGVRQGRGRQERRGRRGGFGAGPREEWTPPRDGQTARQAGVGGHEGRQRQRRRARTGGGRRPSNATDGPTASEAYRTLGLEPGADESSVKRAYREKVKQVHPDADGGDEQRFKEVTAAYERLTD